MPYRQLEIFIPESVDKEMQALLEKHEITAWHKSNMGKKDGVYTLYVENNLVQEVTDELQKFFKKDGRIYLAILPLETLLPKKEKDKQEEEEAKKKKKFLGISREELYEQVAKGARYDAEFMALVILSTIVAAIGLLEDNVAVVIGAMVIAPLLGPNLSLALGTTLGDTALMGKALKANGIGFTLSLLISIGIGLFWFGPLESEELLSRTNVGFAGIILAIASGAAAVLSLTSGVSSVLVGVMVAVALLPPAVTFGIMLGAAEWGNAYGAFILLAVNVVCVNLAAKSVFLLKGVKPRTWWEQKRAQKVSRFSLLIWTVTLVLLAGLIYLNQQFDSFAALKQALTP